MENQTNNWKSPMNRILHSKVIKFLVLLIGIVLLLLICGVSYIYFSGIPKYAHEKPNYSVTVTPEKVERGKKLALILCAHCHMNPETRLLTGTRMLEAPKEFGTIYSQNITQDKTYGIGNWTDGEILYLLRTGIKRDGQYAPPYMAKLPLMADEDLESIIAFLRSDDPMVAAAAVPDTPCEPSLLTKFLTRVAFKPLPMPAQKIPMPDTTNPVEHGKYLVFSLDCYSCHSADFKTMNVLEPEKSPGYMGGGNKLLNMEGETILSANITPDKETGIGNWTLEQFDRALRSGLKEGEAALRFPMVPFPQLDDTEVKAIFEYLKTIPPIQNKIARPK